MRGEIIAVEGVCCAGKSTIVKRLASHLTAGVVPELPEFGRNLFKPFQDGENILYNGYRSISIEQVRMKAALGLNDLAAYVLLDRSFLSTLALGYGAIDLIGTAAYRELADRVLSVVRTNVLSVPDKTLYINVDGNTVQKRNEIRVPPLGEYWVNPRRVERQNYFYQSLSIIDGVETVDGARSREEVVSNCVDLSQTPTTISKKELIIVVEKFSNHIP